MVWSGGIRQYLAKAKKMELTEVILVDELDQPVGAVEKMAAHREALLHRAFSVFIFNSNAEMLLQQRAFSKYHSGGLWTNACCSHPLPGEDTACAATRRLGEEMGIYTPLNKIFDFTYRHVFDNGLTEYEFDHVFIGTYEGAILPNPAEVSDYCFKGLPQLSASMKAHPAKYTPWFHIAFPMVEKWIMTAPNLTFQMLPDK